MSMSMSMSIRSYGTRRFKTLLSKLQSDPQKGHAGLKIVSKGQQNHGHANDDMRGGGEDWVSQA